MNKQETIKYLTDLMATVQMAYFKGRMEGHSLWVHERGDDSAAISIDLYHFCGDGEPVCEGLKPCDITDFKGETGATEVFCICYDPDNGKRPLTFLVDCFDEDGNGDSCDVSPDQLPEQTLTNVAAWLEAEMRKKPTTKKYHGGDEVYSRKHGKNIHIMLAHHTNEKVDYYMMVDGSKVMQDEVEEKH